MTILPDAQEISILYLYGGLTVPSDLTSEDIIRLIDETTTITVNVNDYFDGPARFANPNFF